MNTSASCKSTLIPRNLTLALELALNNHTESIGDYAVDGTGWPWHVLAQQKTIAEITARMDGCTDEQRAQVPSILKSVTEWFDDGVVMQEKNSEFLPEAAAIMQNWFIKGELPEEIR